VVRVGGIRVGIGTADWENFQGGAAGINSFALGVNEGGGEKGRDREAIFGTNNALLCFV